MTETITKTGRVKKLVTDKGYGFLTPDMAPGDSSAAVFFHRTSCEAFDRLIENDPVSYVEEFSVKGPRAANVVPLPSV
jgi:cold shock CspA family protein